METLERRRFAVYVRDMPYSAILLRRKSRKKQPNRLRRLMTISLRRRKIISRFRRRDTVLRDTRFGKFPPKSIYRPNVSVWTEHILLYVSWLVQKCSALYCEKEKYIFFVFVYIWILQFICDNNIMNIITVIQPQFLS